MCKTPELAAQVTIQPIERLGVRPAILFSDILVPVEAMASPRGSTTGTGPVRKGDPRAEGRDSLIVPDPLEKVPFVMEERSASSGRRSRGRCRDRAFSGARSPLPPIIVEGGTSKNFIQLKKLMYQAPEVYRSLMKKNRPDR